MTADELARGGVLVVAGTHGNERNAVHLLPRWRLAPERLSPRGLAVSFTEGNPEAIREGRRYCDRDLNRAFLPALLEDPTQQELEVRRARDLLDTWGPRGRFPCAVALDLHSTTAAMGNSLVVYGRRPADLALAAGLQGRLGLPIYLHEGDPSQRGYLVERWPCGLVIEVGPVPQGVVSAAIGERTEIALAMALAVLEDAREGVLRLPERLVIHRHRRSLDVPRDGSGKPLACVHPRLQDRDWRPLRPSDPLFLALDGRPLSWEPGPQDPEAVWPVFINEAAYEEKGIALSLTEREVWTVDPEWGLALSTLAALLLSADDGNKTRLAVEKTSRPGS
ncbi:MAG: aspartoacylase [Cyanobacteria bacterium K_Offshore_surface_m2_239]|nr:aspartoacylase [Cyanobacteria bacterium K_Offshore_surface_m2_239]